MNLLGKFEPKKKKSNVLQILLLKNLQIDTTMNMIDEFQPLVNKLLIFYIYN